MSAQAVKTRFLALKMRWRVLLIIVAVYAVGGIGAALYDEARENNPG